MGAGGGVGESLEGGRSVARDVLGGGRPTERRMNGLPPDDWRGAVAVAGVWLSHPALRSAALLSALSSVRSLAVMDMHFPSCAEAL